jgi:large subunit ribosomal protein L4
MDLTVRSSENGEAVGTVSVPDALFGAAYNEALVHQIVTAYLSGGRAGTKAQKSRAEVSGGGAKPWRQKGTGRARAGSSRSPLWRKGGVTFAATPRSYEQKVNRKMYGGALRSIVSELVRQGRLWVVDTLSIAEPRTRVLAERLARLGLAEVLIVGEDLDRNLYLASRNLPRVTVTEVAALDPTSLVGSESVLLTEGALRRLQARLG